MAPTVDDPTVIEHTDRKPGPGMLFRAARTLRLNLDASWIVGDLVSDVLAGLNAGCRGSVLLRSGISGVSLPASAEYHLADDLAAAAELILGLTVADRPRDSRR
jgi:histidinol phosphatase-like enzyme